MAEAAADRFWAFSLELYGRPGVAPACLSLQDRCGLDVNLLLFCCWTAAEGRPLSDADLRRAIDAVAPWHEAAVGPIRAVRRRLKGGVAGVAAAETDALRRRIAEIEIEAERIAQQALAALPATGTGNASATARTALASLRTYLELRDVAIGPAERADLETILRAAFPADPGELSPDASG
ncbi:TIGR02444 family protein [Rhodospirillaceae bacterium SYSU D60014]|uniref:TIGR02444 family protein n=1 Tax=Virgifigura deserti TaxID=2268457 RepID=UPI000E661BF2